MNAREGSYAGKVQGELKGKEGMGELNVLKCGLGTKGTKEDGGAFRCEEGHSVTGAAVGGPLLVRSG